jgi:hypothetical protein
MLHSLVLWAGLSQYLQEGKMGAAKCTVLTLEEKCDDLVSATSGG